MMMALVALGALLALTAVSAPFASAATPTTWNMTVGQGQGQIAADDFFPEEVSVHQGDTIHFANPFAEPHTVTFVPAGTATPPLIIPEAAGPPHLEINPLASNPTSSGSGAVTFDNSQYFNSGLLMQGNTVDLTFPKQGTFKFICLIHPGMSVTVSVVGAATPVQTQAQLDADGKADSDQVIANGVSAASQIKSTKQQLPDGSYNWRVQAGGHANEADILEFNSPNVTINAGDTVTWTNPTDTPHTVTFAAGNPLPNFIQPVPQPSGPPILELSLGAVLPSGGPTFDGTTLTSSGIIDTVDSPTNTYSLKFTKPGTYTYVCLIHEGMTGTITVAGATSPPATSATPGGAPSGVQAPNTGSGPPTVGAGHWPPALLLLVSCGLLLLMSGAALRSARRS